VAEDWRLTIRLREGDHTSRVLRALHEHEVEEDVRRQLGDRIAVSGSGDRLFLYADTEHAARSAERIVESVLKAHGLQGDFALDRWHHEEERWEDASVPLPRTAAEHRSEHERLEQQETADSEASGLAEWELRIELATHRDAHALAEQLQGERFQVVRRWKYLLIGTKDEDDAHALARRLQAELPPGAIVHIEPGSGLAWPLTPRNPFAVFGGLGT
jgi:hypothetical protein